MSLRNESLQIFLDAVFVAFDQFANAAEARRSIRQISAALERPGTARAGREADCLCALSLMWRFPSIRPILR